MHRLAVGAVLREASVLEPGGLEVDDAGRIARLGVPPVPELRRLVAVPGYRNAHVHLDLSLMTGVPRATRGFAGWVLDLLKARGPFDPAALQRGAEVGAREALSTGTTAVGDIDASGAAAAAGAAAGLRGIVFLERLGGRDPAVQWAEADDWLASFPSFAPGGRLRPGLSPHAPYSTPSALYRGAAERRANAGVPLSTHAAETRAEREFLAAGTGEFAELLARLGMRSPREGEPPSTPIRLLDELGCLTDGVILAHGNYPDPGEIELLARRGAVVVYCPRSHAFFGHSRHPLLELRAAGVRVALGTDSRASNAGLDMGAELAYLRAARPEVTAESAFRMATEVGAQALAAGSGRLEEGESADLFLADFGGEDPPRDAAVLLDRLTLREYDVVATFVGGELRHVDESAAGAPALLPLTRAT